VGITCRAFIADNDHVLSIPLARWHRILDPGSMMTNARVTAVVQATRGRELTPSYKNGSQKIVVPEGAPVVTAVPADRSALKPGEYVFFGAEQAADGKLTAPAASKVSKDGVRPPM
jgi:hypothetical protein